MDLREKSILDNVIYLDIETTGLDEYTSEIIEIGGVKIKDSVISAYTTLIRPRGTVPQNIYELCSGLKPNELRVARRLGEVKSEILEFLEDLPLICHNGGFERRFLIQHIPELKNEIYDSMELAAILEPWRKEYNLDSLLKEVTDIEKNESHRALEDSIDTMRVVNALLSRQWYREDIDRNKKKNSLFKILVQDYGLKKKWHWTRYIERPVFFLDSDYPYVNYQDSKKEEVTLEKIKINYNEFEDLLKREEIWNNGGDFGYEYRESQRKFSQRIRETIEGNEKIFIEAPTGSGKTFAYVLIAALEAYKNKKRNKAEDASFIISTDTKELQNQLIDRDIPNVLKKLGLEDKLNYGAIKGKSNYICTERLIKVQHFREDLEGILAEIFFKRLCKDGEYGDSENISYWAYNHFNLKKYLKDVLCDNEECNLDKCYRPCYLKKRYVEIPSENITVVNHSLLASWPYGEKKKITHLIIDEAHNLMDKCYDFFSEEFKSDEYSDFLKLVWEKEPTIYRHLTNLNSSHGYRETIELDKLKYWVSEIENIMAILINKCLELKLSGGEYNFRTEFFLVEAHLEDRIRSLEPFISKIKENIYGLYSLINKYINNITLEGEEGKDDNEYIALCNYIMKLKTSFDTIDRFLENPEGKKEFAKVFQIANDYSYFILTNIPLNIDKLVNENILKDVKSTTFLSATMRISNSFGRIKNQLGQREAKELIVPPTFKLKERSKIFTLKDIGSYNSGGFIRNTAQFIYEMSEKLNGHILALFTNNLRRKAVEEELRELVKGSRIEIHTSKKSIKYLNDKNRQIIILGSRGFFEGIDVPGDGLTCVMLDKLPNKSVEEPLLKAITVYQNKQYRDVNYPQVCITVKQVYGRLIRSVMDYGYFCILDPGQNNNTLALLERDLGGPRFKACNTNEVLESVDRDFYNWKVYNLKCFIRNIRTGGKDIKTEFDLEARKRKSFWELEKGLENELKYKNINLMVKGPNK
ncbi:helicase C-terminal domain-containing protein [Clostridium paraputrificum]|uniref:helicase C-terminal domain-containing protein n=1 Tax=Clostridium TaxID=1485 RepID=UPI003D336841